MLQLTNNTKHLGQTLRHLSAPILTILVAMLLTVVAWGQDLDKGIYTITNNVSHDNPVGEGMARSYTETTSDVEVNDNGTFVTLAFNNTQYMGDFTISVGGSKVTYETTALAGNVKKLKFKVPSLSTSIKVGLYVEPMNTTVDYAVTLNESSLKLIKKTEPAVEPVKEPAAESVQNSGSTSNGSAASQAVNNTTNSTTNSNNSSAHTTNTTVSKKEQPQKGQATTSTEAAKKTEETVKKEQKPSSDEKTVQEEAQNITNDATAESQETVDINLENADQTSVEEKLEAETEKQDEAQVETQEESKQDSAEVENTEAEETIVSAASEGQSSMKNIIFIIIGIAVVAAIGGVIYLKRK